MKKVEIKSIGLGSIFKATIYMLILPMLIPIFIGGLIFLIGIFSQEIEAVIGGIIYSIVFVMAIPLSGLLYMIMGLIYNLFAGKFGGLVITLKDKDEIE